MNKKVILSILSILALSACEGTNIISSGTSSQNQSIGTSQSSSSSSSSQSDTSTSSSTSSVDTVTQDAKQIQDLVEQCIEGKNYTLTLNDMDGELVRKYMKNAYYSKAPEEKEVDTIGYAQNEEGVFSFQYENEAIVPTSTYLKNSDGELCKDLYTAKTYDQWEQKDLNIIYSFALLDINSFNDLASNYTSNGYTIDINSVINLIPYLSQQMYQSAQVKVALTEGGFEFKFNVSIGFSTTVYSLVVSDIGSTSIDLIETYLSEGNGALPEVRKTKDVVKELFDSKNYTYTRQMEMEDMGMGTVNVTFLVTEKYVSATIEGMGTNGYVDVPANEFGYAEGIHMFSYFESSLTVEQDVLNDVELDKVYGFSGDFIDLFEEGEEANTLVTSDSTAVINYLSNSTRFDPMQGTTIGEIKLVYSEESQSITMTCTTYQPKSDGGMQSSGKTFDVVVTNFNKANFQTLGESMPFMGELDALVGNN